MLSSRADALFIKARSEVTDCVSMLLSEYRFAASNCNGCGGAVAGSNGTFNRGRQAGVGPVASKEQIAPARGRFRAACILLRRGRKGRPPFAHNLPGWQWRVEPRDCGDLGPNRLRQFFPWR